MNTATYFVAMSTGMVEKLLNPRPGSRAQTPVEARYCPRCVLVLIQSDGYARLARQLTILSANEAEDKRKIARAKILFLLSAKARSPENTVW